MNPDISDSIHRHRCVETVFITAGEWDGVSGSMSRQQYAASRNQGTRAGYAAMANVPNNWTRTATQINGHPIEVDTLVGAPNVKLMYLSIRDGGDSVSYDNLQDLYQGARSSVATIVPTGSPSGITSVTYTRVNLIQTLLSIMTAYRATTIRTQDYMPSALLSGDHADHVYGALFVMAAAQSYRGIGNDQHVTLTAYRDYNIIDSPANLDADQINQKNIVINAYKAFDPIFAIPSDQATLASRMYYRWPVAPTWVTANANGRLQAFDVQGGHLVTWQQDASGNWLAMQDLGNNMLQPAAAAAINTDGTMEVFAIKQTISSTGQVQQDLQYLRQVAPGGAFGTWQSLSGPGPSAGNYDIGSPTVVANGDGRLEVFLKASDGSLATVYQTAQSGGFSGWVGLGGNGLIETPAAILRTDGRIEIYSASLGVVRHWLQRSPNGAVVYDTAFTSVRAAGAPSAGLNQDGRPEIFYRHAGDGQIYTAYQMTSGMWFGGEVALAGQSSQGAPAVTNSMPLLQTGSRLNLFARNGAAGFDTLAQASDNGSFQLPWHSTNAPYSQHAPAAILAAGNKIHLLVVSPDGVLTEAQP